MKYKVRKSLLGALEAVFNCPFCAQEIAHPIKDAGTVQKCPLCGADYLFPPGVLEHPAQGNPKHQPNEAEKPARSVRPHSHDHVTGTPSSTLPDSVPNPILHSNTPQGSGNANLILDERPSSQLHRPPPPEERVRAVCWADRTTWAMFRWLRYGFALQILLGYGSIGFGIVALLLSACVYFWPQLQKSIDVAAIQLASTGIASVAFGYALCVASALASVLIHIERNTRGIILED